VALLNSNNILSPSIGKSSRDFENWVYSHAFANIFDDLSDDLSIEPLKPAMQMDVSS
jgi:hypothetical protein